MQCVTVILGDQATIENLTKHLFKDYKYKEAPPNKPVVLLRHFVLLQHIEEVVSSQSHVR